jgi:hypothetical protein
MPKNLPEGITIMEQFRLIAEAMRPFSGLDTKETTGVVNLIRPDGSQPAPKGFRADGLINGPWGMAIDGNDDVWVANGLGRSVMLLAGAEPKGYPAGTKPGDLIHNFRLGSIQIVTMGAVDPAGDVWVANNWNDYNVAGGLGRSVPHIDLGRRRRLYYHVWRRGPGENAADGPGQPAVKKGAPRRSLSTATCLCRRRPNTSW